MEIMIGCQDARQMHADAGTMQDAVVEGSWSVIGVG